MTVERIDCGPRLSEATILGETLYLSGQIPEEGTDTYSQTVSVLKEIDALLAKMGSSKNRILSATIYLADISAFAEMNRAWDAWVPAGAAPARATVEAKLADSKYLVEIMVIAAK